MTTEWLLQDDLKKLLEKFPNAKYTEEFQQGTISIPAEELKVIFEFIKNDPAYTMNMLSSVTAVDFLSSRYAQKPNLTGREEEPLSPKRFDVIYHFFSVSKNKRLRVSTSCGGEYPEVASAYAWWRSAHFMEREVFDMFGIRFKDHPNLKRVLLYDEFEGHPLRKDYAIDDEQALIPQRNPEAPND